MTGIKWSVCISESQRSFNISFSNTDYGIIMIINIIIIISSSSSSSNLLLMFFFIQALTSRLSLDYYHYCYLL